MLLDSDHLTDAQVEQGEEVRLLRRRGCYRRRRWGLSFLRLLGCLGCLLLGFLLGGWVAIDLALRCATTQMEEERVGLLTEHLS